MASTKDKITTTTTTTTNVEKAGIEDRTIESIVKQFRGGEHRLAGQRASEFVFATGKANQKLLDRITEEAPGIDRYLSAPETPAPLVEDQGGNPLATQPENTPDETNLSNEQARKEQDEIDDHLAKGRKRRVEKGGEQAATGGEDATKLNPDASTK